MANIRVIEAKSQERLPIEKRKLRVGAYARVSTDHNDQESSFNAQQTHFASLVMSNPEWELVDIYADEESGTGVAKRENFMRMIQDCEDGKIDLILTKSISRFARNTLDCLKYIRKLKEKGIPIIFTKEGVNTMDGSGEVLVTILASIAQQESASISQNCQLGVKYHYQEGKACSGNHKLLGLDRTPDGSFKVIPEEAWIIRRIFREYLDGYSPKHIVERLIADGVDGTKITRKGYKIERIWSTAGIKGILSNEKYAGDCLLQKFYTVDFLTKKVAPNHGERPQYYVEDGHDPVVPKGIFLQVQAERERRRYHRQEFRYLHEIGLSGKIFCEDCGLPFRRKDDHGYKYWYCESGRKSRHPDSECHNGRIREEKLQEIVIAAFNQLPEHEQDLMHLQARVRVMGIDKADEMLKQIDGEIESTTGEEQERLRVQRHEIAEQRTVYADKDVQIRSLLDRIAAIRGVKTPFELDRAGKCDDPEEFFRLTRTVYPAGPVREFSDDDARKFIEKVVLGEKITVVFKAGISMEFDR